MWKTLISWLTTPKSETELAHYVSLRAELSDVRAELKELKALLKGIELEWDQVFDKLQHQMARIVKRAGKAAQEAAETQIVQPVEPDPLDPVGMHGRLQAARRRFRGVS